MQTLPRPLLSARPNLRHPLCRGLRLYSSLGYGISAVNLAGPHLGTPTNTPVAITGGQGPAMRYTKGSNMRTGFTPNGLATGGDVTAIICAKTALAGGSTFNTLVGCWDESAGYKGWLLHSLDNGGFIGIRMIVGDGGAGVGGNLYPTGDTTYADGNYHVFAGSYGRWSQEVRVYQDGRRYNQETGLATYNVSAPSSELGVGGLNLHSSLASTSDVAWVAIFDRQLADQEIYQWSNGTWEMFEEESVLSADTISPPVIYSDHYRRAQSDLLLQVEEFVVPVYKSIAPFLPAPSPFDENRLGGRIVPRVPIRLQRNTQGGQGGQQAPEKIDPRSVRFTEIVQSVINGLISSGGIYQAGPDDWRINYIPRRVSNVDAYINELFFSTDSNRIAYKQNDGSIQVY